MAQREGFWRRNWKKVFVLLGIGYMVKKNQLPGTGSVLLLDLRAPLSDTRTSAWDDRISLLDLQAMIEFADADPRIRGIVANISSSQVSLVNVEELTTALSKFKKPKIAFANSLGMSANRPLYLASAFNEVYMQPMGDVVVGGLSIETIFLKKFLERHHLLPQFARRSSYKTAPNTFTEEKFTPEQKETSDYLLSSLYSQIIAGIAKGRHLHPATVKSYLDGAPMSTLEAKNRALIDGLMNWNNLGDLLNARFAPTQTLSENAWKERLARFQGEMAAWVSKETASPPGPLFATTTPTTLTMAQLTRANYVPAAKYYGAMQKTLYRAGVEQLAEEFKKPWSFAKNIIKSALKLNIIPIVNVSGTIGDDVNKTVELLRYIERSPMKAMVLRVNSPGGSVLGSEAIWSSVKAIRDKGKTVIVSFGDYAASGGYYVSAPASQIFTNPSTITGSIGVFGGKFTFGKAIEQYGITTDRTDTGGPYASFGSLLQPWTETQFKLVQSHIDNMYMDFKKKVAHGRGLPLKTVEELAQGKVYTGIDAKQKGLADRIGGFGEAVEAARGALPLEDREWALLIEDYVLQGAVESELPLGLLKNYISAYFTSFISSLLPSSDLIPPPLKDLLPFLSHSSSSPVTSLQEADPHFMELLRSQSPSFMLAAPFASLAAQHYQQTRTQVKSDGWEKLL